MPFAPAIEAGNTAALIAMSVILGIGYLVALVLMQALSLILITQPVLSHYIATIRVENAGALAAIQQREAETGIDAEGFADALDIGGAI